MNFEEIKVPMPWGYISGKWWGSRKIQPILSIHGHLDNAGSFDTLAPLLIDENTSVFSIDLPGHGFSSHLPKGMYYYPVTNMIIIIRRIVRYFQWNSITVMGHSLGGLISLMYAATFANDVSKYIGLDTAGLTYNCTYVTSRVKKELESFVQFNSADGTVMEYSQFLDIMKDIYENVLSSKSCEILAKRKLKAIDDYSYNYIACEDQSRKYDLWGNPSKNHFFEYASQVRCDVLNIAPSSEFDYASKEEFKQINEIIKENARSYQYVVVPGTHFVHLNNPENVSDIIKTF